jgi:hypothetical protein
MAEEASLNDNRPGRPGGLFITKLTVDRWFRERQSGHGRFGRGSVGLWAARKVRNPVAAWR